MIMNEREGATPPEKRRTAAMAIAAAEVPRMTKQGHLLVPTKQLCRDVTPKRETWPATGITTAF